MTTRADKNNIPLFDTVRDKIYRIRQAANTINGLIELNLQASIQYPSIAADLSTIQQATKEITAELHSLLAMFLPEAASCTNNNNETENQANQKTILIVDDNATNRRILKHIIEKQNHIAREAVNGREACSIVELENIDLVFMDLSMPVMDGLTATENIRKNLPENKRNIPIYAVTAHTFPDDKERCLNVGMNDVITKPVRASEITNVLSIVFNSNSQQK
jgi:CheY-like chemotaxis protein